jgi:hypothetical protein
MFDETRKVEHRHGCRLTSSILAEVAAIVNEMPAADSSVTTNDYRKQLQEKLIERGFSKTYKRHIFIKDLVGVCVQTGNRMIFAQDLLFMGQLYMVELMYLSSAFY